MGYFLLEKCLLLWAALSNFNIDANCRSTQLYTRTCSFCNFWCCVLANILSLYTVSEKTCHSTFASDFAKCKPIVKILSLLVGNFITALLEIHCEVCWWKSFENRSAFGKKLKARVEWHLFFWKRCILQSFWTLVLSWVLKQLHWSLCVFSVQVSFYPADDLQASIISCLINAVLSVDFSCASFPLSSSRQHLEVTTHWRPRGKIVRTVICCGVYNSCTQWYAHIYEQFLKLIVGYGRPA